MSDQIDSLNNVFSFKDAVKAVENMLHEARVQRDSFGPFDETGLYRSWDMYHISQERVEVLEDVLQALYIEESVATHVRAHDDRGGEL